MTKYKKKKKSVKIKHDLFNPSQHTLDTFNGCMDENEDGCLIFRYKHGKNNTMSFRVKSKWGITLDTPCKIAYYWYYKMLKPGVKIKHTCGNYDCCNPKHMIQ